ncbi:MAG: hypothetical protein DMG11_29590 [Acidobacteria bacterium]|nr:MAG: hypothetical protein DMG11_29590 [Acidobacteriota bacterium]
MRIFFTVCGFAIFTAVLVGQQPASQQDLVNRYCLTCHNDKLQTGGLTLEKLDAAHPARDAETWEKVIRKLRAGLMPPSGAPRPDRATLDTFRASLEASIDQAASERPNPGATALHRLNRTEYANAIRDLLAIDVDVATILPADDSSEGLDNIADVLGTSPALLERYIGAAAKISRLAVGDTDIGAQSVTYKVRGDLTQDDHIPGLPVGTRGGIVIKHNFPVDGEYLFKFALLKVNFGPEYGGASKGEQLEMSLNGERVALLNLESVPYYYIRRGGGNANAPAVPLEIRLPLKAGPQTIMVTFIKRTSAEVSIRLHNRASFVRRGNHWTLQHHGAGEHAQSNPDLRLPARLGERGTRVREENRVNPGTPCLSAAGDRRRRRPIAQLLSSGPPERKLRSRYRDGPPPDYCGSSVRLPDRTGSVEHSSRRHLSD